tara:strand:- start:8818 stop:10467 length:1650 start_codon:yes stop_codon:yes gene_type:complete
MRFLTVALVFLSVVLPAFADDLKYTCPMHPHYIADEAGNCPICGMELVPLEVETSQAYENKSENATDKKAEVTHKAIVTIEPETIQNMGVRTEKAQITRFGTSIRSYGLVTENVRLKQDISSRIAGWVEKLNITAVGDVVKKGDLLFTLYSPELVSAQQDFLAAIAAGSETRVTSTAKRLQSLGVQQQYIDILKKNKEKSQYIPFFAETDGIVSSLMVNQGAYVKPGMQIATIQDYSVIWINASVAEKDLNFLSKESQAHVIFPNLGGEERTASIDYIYPTIDKASRTGQVRLVLDNSNNILKPGAYADVVFETNIKKRLAVPTESILKSSEGDYVVVALGNGRFQSQKITTGLFGTGWVEVLSGITENDIVVVSSQFLIDSESALKESFLKLQYSQLGLSDIQLTKDELAMLDHYVDAALYIHEALTTETEFNAPFLKPTMELGKIITSKLRGTKLQSIIEGADNAVFQAHESVTDSELRASLALLMTTLEPWLFKGKPEHYKQKGLHIFIDHPTSNIWAQLDAVGVNPYGKGHVMSKAWPEKNEKTQ